MRDVEMDVERFGDTMCGSPVKTLLKQKQKGGKSEANTMGTNLGAFWRDTDRDNFWQALNDTPRREKRRKEKKKE